MNIHQKIIEDLSRRITDDMDSKFIEGLRRKGFEFENNIELEHFIKSRCKCEYNVNLKERIYYVDNIPFFFHDYSMNMDFDMKDEGNKITMTANNGRYAYL